MRRHSGATLAVLFTLSWCGCGGATSPAGLRPTPSPTPIPSTVYWRIQLMNENQVSFGLRIRLDGEEVYYNRSTTQDYHVVELERPYVRGSHEIQFEILQAARRRSIYRAHVTVQVRPTGPSFFGQGVPTTLAIGERLTLNVVI